MSEAGRSGIAAVDGSVAVLGGGVFFANRIDDAFAVVDAGAPDVMVQYATFARPCSTFIPRPGEQVMIDQVTIDNVGCQ